MNEKYLSIERVASGYQIKESDVFDLIEQGHIPAITDSAGTHWIPLTDFQRFGKSFPSFLTEKMMKNLWESVTSEKDKIQAEVRDQFLKNSQIILERCDQAIKCLEDIHSANEPKVAIRKSNNGHVASFIMYARIISLLNSISYLLKKGVISEAVILYRPLWEAILLSKYFHISDRDKDNHRAIRKWFEKSELISARDVRDYLSIKLNYQIETLRKLNNGFSSFIHHSYPSIMEHYRVHAMNGFGHKFEDIQGFDYHQTSMGRDLVPVIEAFENLIQPSLTGFAICFTSSLNLGQAEIDTIQKEIAFFNLPFNERMNQTFTSHTTKRN